MGDICSNPPSSSPSSSPSRLSTAALDGDMKGRDGSGARASHSLVPQREGTHPDRWERKTLQGQRGWMDAADPGQPHPRCPPPVTIILCRAPEGPGNRVEP